MNAKARQLRALLDTYENGTGAFLADVAIAIESLYAEDGAECPEGFGGLDVAIDAFDAAEEQ